HRKVAGLAEARRQEVGDGRDALCVADADQLAQQEPPAHEDDRGPHVDGHEFDAAAGRGSDGTVERPRGAIDRNRKRVDDRRTQKPGVAAVCLLLRHPGDQEEEPDIGNAGENDEIRRQHYRAPDFLSRSASSLAPRADALTKGRRKERKTAPATRNNQMPNRYAISSGTPNMVSRMT